MGQVIKEKESDLQLKLQIKNNMKHIMQDVDDQRFTNIENYV